MDRVHWQDSLPTSWNSEYQTYYVKVISVKYTTHKSTSTRYRFFLSIQCPGGTFTPGVRSSKNFSDEAVNFVRAHPLMFHPVYPIHRRPLVVRTGVDYRYTALVVDQVDAVDGRYEVLFLGTGEAAARRLKVFLQLNRTLILHKMCLTYRSRHCAESHCFA